MEYVSGCVIGSIITQKYYKFYSRDGVLLWDAGRFESNERATEAFWTKFSVDPVLLQKYKTETVEMRAWE